MLCTLKASGVKAQDGGQKGIPQNSGKTLKTKNRTPRPPIRRLNKVSYVIRLKLCSALHHI